MSGLDPGRAVCQETSRGDEQMGVGMVFQRPRPGVQDGEDGGGATDPVAILEQLEDSGSGFAEQRGVEDTLV